MIVLGLAGGLRHDASAALVVDGQLVSLAEEERFIRSRHAHEKVPVEATAYCLAAAGITLSDVDVIATSWLADASADVQLDMVGGLLEHPYFAGAHPPRVEQVAHPIAHAAAAYHTSGFDEATVISTDGVGDRIATMIAHGRGGSIEVKRHWPISESLGMFYLGLTRYLGFNWGQEGKVMGLASYGVPDDDWMPFTLHDDGGYHTGLSPLGEDRPNYGRPLVRAWSARVQQRYGDPRPPQFRYDPDGARLQPFVDTGDAQRFVAASGQRALERALLHIVEHAVRETGCRDVVLGGGVGLNCTANGVIAQSPFVDRLVVFPASGDGGTSAGAALAVAAAAGERSGRALTSAGLGPEFTDEQIRAALDARGVPYTVVDDIADTVAELITDGQVVGWFQGRAEFGPRALGQRSILASPLQRSMHHRVNAIKYREQWRPLAPSMSAAAAEKYLLNPGPSRFMLSACQVREEMRDEIPAVVHVDGSCRPQVLDDDAPGPYRRLLERLATRGHPEVVMNTSFNLANEPIVHSPHDALRSFYGSGLDALAIGSMLVHKPVGHDAG
ncbi:carbamoyltransferase family protein [Dactylosporangium matsuzakiense]|uniref:Carbamoyltransferase n=1 Tax=Dactylosporangium matsuzakiense TaxID=53360 RepID=A0A9W6KFQ0_9ACTN|nr:carbamoyltransferase C-terminal domain-containing protein [Dactylosporangium matsuzakiense]GLK99209.1 carbamoyltransferase [Dactylosporangium matsuzakiense]